MNNTNKLNVIGISGHICAGKDTIADCFVKSGGFVKVSLADPMKRFAYRVFEFTEDQLWGPSDNRNALDKRYYTGSDFWLNAKYNFEDYGSLWIADVLKGSTNEQKLLAYEKLCDWYNMLEMKYPELSPRVCLQLLGTEWGRDAVHTDVWVEYLYRTSKKLLTKQFSYSKTDGLRSLEDNNITDCLGVVIPDVRFQNELEFFKNNDCKTIRVIRPGTDYKAVGVGVSSHKSEMAQEEFDSRLFDAIVHNDGTLDELLSKASELALNYKFE